MSNGHPYEPVLINGVGAEEVRLGTARSLVWLG